ncbi:hypothetical protein N7468_008791 [Penicillium chermesinum]|uniref:Uncharacterized protein n=1 Tax=Penicillium chermesinum TaxID=63820 RepID=A0A9W9TE83_9EURO|nr:uncharacterized protein N7468_008791 [Penicillium chermesinum]KAJ5219587.1 hypothetical protein N7468_008791 [Penicillium chermesinum]KAJ6153600.1 hypothetical protein N7470_006559 [Penicillium chermesinum]
MTTLLESNPRMCPTTDWFDSLISTSRNRLGYSSWSRSLEPTPSLRFFERDIDASANHYPLKYMGRELSQIGTSIKSFHFWMPISPRHLHTLKP